MGRENRKERSARKWRLPHEVTINHLFDEHFAHATVTSGVAALHDIVETESK